MFDGNPRSRPRAVNLSSTTRRNRRQQHRQNNNNATTRITTTTTISNSAAAAVGGVDGRARILEESRLIRMNRWEDARRKKASTDIQRTYRGYVIRVSLARTWEQRLQSNSTKDNTPGNNQQIGMDMDTGSTSITLSVRTTTLNRRLSFPVIFPARRRCSGGAPASNKMKGTTTTTGTSADDDDDDEIVILQDWLTHYSENLIQQQENEQHERLPYAHRIVSATLRVLKHCGGGSRSNNINEETQEDDSSKPTTSKNSNQSRIQELERILHALVWDNNNDDDSSQQQQAMCWRRLGNAEGFVHLIDTFVVIMQQNSTTTTTQTTTHQHKDSKDHLLAYLWKLIIMSSPTTSAATATTTTDLQIATQALHSSLLLRWPVLASWSSSKHSLHDNAHYLAAIVMVLSNREPQQHAYEAAAAATTKNNSSKNKNNISQSNEGSKDLTLLHKAIRETVLGGHETNVLYNALQTYSDQEQQQQKTQQQKMQSTSSSSSSSSFVLLLLIDQLLPSEAAIMAEMVVRHGYDYVQSLFFPNKDVNSINNSNKPFNDDDADMDDDDDDADDDDVVVVDDPQQSSSKKARMGVGVGATAIANTNNKYQPNKWTKSQLLTLSKLDRIYHQNFINKRHDDLVVSVSAVNKSNQKKSRFIDATAHHHRTSLLIARHLAEPNLWIGWAQELFVKQGSNNPEAKVPSIVSLPSPLLLDRAREAYVRILAMLLQATTATYRSRNTGSAHSTFVTSLAFHKQSILLEHLWKYLQQQQQMRQQQEMIVPKSLSVSSWSASTRRASNSRTAADSSSSNDACTYLGWSVFCDIFAHTLIALKDDAFLARYTTMSASRSPLQLSSEIVASQENVLIQAQQVIIHLRALLYEVYWCKPVQLADVGPLRSVVVVGANDGSVHELQQQQTTTQAHEARFRFLLSGTKLWNSLYERWCRLVRHSPFCDESAWWFPTLTTSLSTDAAVVVGVPSSGADSDEQEQVAPRQRQRRRRGQHPNAQLHGQDDMDVEDDSDQDMDEDEDEDEMEAEASSNQEPVDVESEALADAFSDPRMARILTCIPQVLPFERRVKMFHSLLSADKAKTQQSHDASSDMHEAMLAIMRGEDSPVPGRERVEIRRDRLYDDSMRQLNQLGTKLRGRVQVAFINQHGTQEAGIDGGGVFKEFIDDLIKDAFAVEASTASHRLFAVTPLQTLTINTDLNTGGAGRGGDTADADNGLLSHYEFLGRVLGKAVYESILVEPQFCLPFLNQLLGKSNTLEDLKNFDPVYYKNLIKLQDLSAAELESLGLTMEWTTGGGTSGAPPRSVELVRGGGTLPVTKQRVVQYLHLVAHQRLNVAGAVQVRAFLRGFRDLIPAPWVRLFSSWELQKLISGDDSVKGIDVRGLKAATHYASGYHQSQRIIQWFWEIVEGDMTSEQQRQFLKFMTSCSRQPLLGFGTLDPPPCIQQVRLPDYIHAHYDGIRRRSDDSDGGRTMEDYDDSIVKQAPLPTSSTCMNLLKLPNYPTKHLMRDKLFAAIEAGAGFELS